MPLARPVPESLSPTPFTWRRFDPRPAGGPSLAPGGLSPAEGEAVCLQFSGYLTNRPNLLLTHRDAPPLSDGEIAARVFARYGRDTPARLEGPFSCILWHPARRELLAVRDRLGIRTLAYSLTPEELRLATRPADLSEAEAGHLDPSSIARHLCGFPPTAGRTFFRGLEALPPATALRVTPSHHETYRYWCPENGTLPRREGNDDAQAEALLALLRRVMAEHATALATGVTLSGGLDSTSVAALASQVGPRPFALTWTAPEVPEADESRAAARVREFLGLAGLEIPAARYGPLSGDLTAEVVPSEPALGFYTTLWDATFNAARESGLAVVLTGASGDHLFGGNVFSYADLLLQGRWRRLVRDWREQGRTSSLTPVQRLRRMLLGPIWDAWIRPRAPLSLRHPPEWLGDPLRTVLAPSPPPRELGLLPGRALRLRELRDPLLPALVSPLTERARGQGLDLRHPWLDFRLFELAAALPSEQSFAAGVRKGILRRALRGLLPDETLTRPRKIYPTALARRSLREWGNAQARTLLSGMRAEEMGFVRAPALRAAFDRLCAGEAAGAPGLLWHALTLEAWLRRYF